MPRSFDREHIRFWTHARRRRQSQLVLALIVGLAAGAVAVLFEHGLEYAESLRFTLLGALAGNPLRWFIVPLLCGIAGATARMITGAWAPEASGSGIPHVKGVLLGLRSLKKRIIPVKFIGGMLAIGAGFSLGREGPTVQMGAVAGLAVAQMLKTPRRYRPQLIAAGAGAGLAAAFNAPLAGFVFVLEELQREMSPYTYGTALAATVVADVITRTFMGQLPSFHISGVPIPPLPHLPLFLLLGLLCGLLGTLFKIALPGAMNAMQRISGPRRVKAGFVGAAVVRSPLTGVVLILEMTGSHELLFALIVTAMTAYFVADFLGTKPIYEALPDRDLRRSDPSRNDAPDGGTVLKGGDQLTILTSGTCPIPDVRRKGQFGGELA